jgi:uncharacterized protein YdeI (YjbR/CyaY-like superfamily)
MEAPKRTWDKTNQWTNELEVVKGIINRTELVETTKWGGIVYTLNGKNVLGIGGFKNFFTIWFFKGVFLKDTASILVNANEGNTKSLRQWRFKSLADIDEKLVLQYINEAIAVEKAGLTIKPEKKEVAVPELLRQQLDLNSELAAAYAKLSPYRQTELNEYITEAKQEKTKLARLEKVVPIILEGKGLHDKYR